MATKMTKKEMFAAIREMVIDNQAMVDFIDNEIELLNRKSSAKRKPTAKQLENEKFKAEIVKALTEGDTLMNTADICEACGFTSDTMSNQRLTHLLTALRKEKKVRREYVKRKAYFTIGAEPDENEKGE